MPMNGRHLLDTNVIIALFRDDNKVRDRIAASPEVFVPAIAVGELYYGAQHSAHVEENIKQVREFAANSTVLACDSATAEYYGQIKNRLKTRGRPLPENDVWIAAIARQYSLTVVTRDQHFREIDGLFLEEWQPRPGGSGKDQRGLFVDGVAGCWQARQSDAVRRISVQLRSQQVATRIRLSAITSLAEIDQR